MVCHSTRFVGLEKPLGKSMIRTLLTIACLIGVASFVYRDANLNFLNCMGREEIFIYNPNDELGFGTWRAYYRFRMLYRHPFRVSNWITALLFVAAVPFFYFKIYAFRKKQNGTVVGSF